MGNSVGGVGAKLAAAAEEATDEELTAVLQHIRPALFERLRGALDKAKPTWTIDVPPEGGILLCGHPISGNVQSVMMFCLKHLPQVYRFQECDIMKREQHNYDFYAMNPFHQVPAAKMADGTCLYESCAMLRFLARKFAPGLYPADKALSIDMAMDMRTTTFYELWSPIGYHAMGIAKAPEKDSAKKLNQHLAISETVFLKGKYIGGDSLCIADYAMLPMINTLNLPKAKKIGYKLPERWATYLNDAKAELGEFFIQATQAHNMRVDTNTSGRLENY
jgi:glutathione S-transferase